MDGYIHGYPRKICGYDMDMDLNFLSTVTYALHGFPACQQVCAAYNVFLRFGLRTDVRYHVSRNSD